jgi:hypothetical protein
MIVGVLVVSPGPSWAQVCGDGVIDPGETCDPPDLSIDPAMGQFVCRLNCTACGDGVVDVTSTESCDNGGPSRCGECLNNCTWRADINAKCPCADDDATLANLRADVLAACECGSAASHGDFLHCARARLALVSGDFIRYDCRRRVLKQLARSVCGKPGAVTCCRTNAHGLTRCTIKSEATRCTAPQGGSASLGVSEACFDACP